MVKHAQLVVNGAMVLPNESVITLIVICLCIFASYLILAYFTKCINYPEYNLPATMDPRENTLKIHYSL